MTPPLASSGPELDAAQVAGTNPLHVQEQPCLLGSLRLALSVDVVPQELKLGSVSLHRVQSENSRVARHEGPAEPGQRVSQGRLA